jgi:hypothetical protein
MVLVGIREDLEMLRGDEARLLAGNGRFLERLQDVVTVASRDVMEFEGAVALVTEQGEEDDQST